MKADQYAEFALPAAVVEAVRVEEARLATRLTDAGLRYEIDAALLAFRRTMDPLLFVLSTSHDAEGEPTAEWTREYAAKWSAAEAEVVYDYVVYRRLDAIKIATSRWRGVREAAHRSDRLSRHGA